MVLCRPGPYHIISGFYPWPQHSISSRATRKPQALTAPWMEDGPVPSSSSPSGSWSSLSVQEDTSSTELVRSGKLLDVNLRRSSAEVSYGNTKVHNYTMAPAVPGQGQRKPAESAMGGHMLPTWTLHGTYVPHFQVCKVTSNVRGMHPISTQIIFPPEESVFLIWMFLWLI